MRKRKKVCKQRGSRKHGWGDEHRGSGQKGGAGNAGSGKRAQGKKPMFWNNPLGSHGFTSHYKKIRALNLGELDTALEQLVQQGKAKLESQTYLIDLKHAGYGKITGKGSTDKKIVIKGQASARAKTKIEKAGGRIE